MSSSEAAPAESIKIIVLQASDGVKFEVEEKVAIEALTIKNLVDDDCVDSVIPIPNVTGEIMAKVIEYCNRHVYPGETDLKTFDADFMKVDTDTLYDLLMAANYLNIQDLLDLACQTVADMIKGKSPEEIRKTFDIKNDFTPEEEEEVRKQNAWAFD